MLGIGFMNFVSTQIVILCKKLKEIQPTHDMKANREYIKNCAKHHMEIIE